MPVCALVEERLGWPLVLARAICRCFVVGASEAEETRRHEATKGPRCSGRKTRAVANSENQVWLRPRPYAEKPSALGLPTSVIGSYVRV